MVITKGLYLSSRREKIGEVWEGTSQNTVWDRYNAKADTGD